MKLRNLKDLFKKKDKSTDDLMSSKSSQNLYVSVMFLSFIMATGISALINVMMFSQLSPLFYEQMVLIAISITLEGTKVLSIFKASVLHSIGQKIDKIDFDKVKDGLDQSQVLSWKRDRKRKPNQTMKSGKFYFKVYLAFAFIAIFASLGMTLTVTNRTGTETVAATSKTNALIEKAKGENVGYKAQLVTLDFDGLKKAYETAQVTDDQIATDLVDLNSKYRASNYTDAVIYNEIVTIKAKRATLRLAEKKKAYEAAMTEKARLDGLIAANSTLIADSGIALIDVQTTDLEKKGTANMFFLMSQFLVFISEVALRFIILMVISILIEVTVYTAAPEININRKILYYFRKYLPEDLDVDLLLAEFDQDLARFSEAGAKTLPVPESQVASPAPVVLKPLAAKRPRAKKDEVVTARVDPEFKVPQDVLPEPVHAETVQEDVAQEEMAQEEIAQAQEETAQVVQAIPAEVNSSQEITVTPALEPAPIPAPVLVSTESSTQVGDQTFYGKEKKVLPRRTKEPKESKEPKVEVEAQKPVELPKADLPRIEPLKPVELPKLEPTKPIEEPKVEKVEEPKVEPKKVEEPKVSKVSAEVINYRFGKTSEQVKDALVKYVNAMMAGLDDTSSYPAPMKDPFTVASELGIKDRVRDVLLKRLQDMAFNDVPLVKKNPDGTYVTNFNPMFIEEWTTSVVKS